MADATDKRLSSPSPGLADHLKHATWTLHREAERSGFLRDLLSRRASRPGYLLFLRNLLPVYEALEAGLEAEAAAGTPVAVLALPRLYRSAAIRSDLALLHGPGWASHIAVLEVATAYAARVRAARGAGLAGHAYVRYLGDLNGGQILARRLARDLALPADGLRVFAFAAPEGPRTLARSYRAAIDSLGTSPGLDLAAIETEAVASFEGSIALAKAVSRALP